MPKNPKRPKDPNELAKLIAGIASGEIVEEKKDPSAVSLGRKGGLKGGKARADKLTPEQRSDIARNAAKKRWQKG